MGGQRELVIDLLARDKASPAVKSVGRALDDLGDGASRLGRDLMKMDVAIAASEAELRGLARQFANTDDAAQKIDISKAMRKVENDIRRTSKAKAHLKLDDMIDVDETSDLGKTAGKGFAKNLAAGLSDAGPVVTGALVLLVASALPTIGAATAGAVLGAAGAGGIIGGIALASKDARVQAAGKTVASAIGDQLEHAAEPFVPAVLDALGRAQQGFAGFDADLKGIFAASVGYLKPLEDGLIGLVGNALPGIRSAVAAAGPIFAMLGAELPQLGSEIGHLFEIISQHAPEGAAALKLVFDGLEIALPVIGNIIGSLSNMFRVIIDGDLVVLDFIDGLAAISPAAAVLSAASSGLRGELEGVKSSMAATSAASQTTGQSMGFVKAQADTEKTSVMSLKQTLDSLADASISLFDAQIQAKSAIAATTDSIKKNGQATSDNTAKGRENNTALSSLAKAFNTVTSASEASGATAGRTNSVFATQRSRFIAAAEAAGYSSGKARDLANSLLKIPTERTINITANTGTASQRIDAIKASLARLPGSKTITIRTRADIPAGLSVGQLMRERGGPVRAGQPYVVGEKRPEVFVPDQNGTILPRVGPNMPSSMSGSSAGGGGVMAITINSGGSRMDDLLVEILSEAVRARGGIVQNVLGKG